MFRVRLNNKGFTLSEIAIALGIIATLVMTSVSVDKILRDSTGFGEANQAALSLSTTIRERLLFSDLCTGSIGTGSGQNSSINVANLLAGTQQISVNVPGIQAGANGNQTVLMAGQLVSGAKIKINDLRLTNVRNVGGTRYVAQVLLGTVTTKGLVLRPSSLATIQFDLSGNSIDKCVGVNSSVNETVCANMGCNWQTTGPTPGCMCKTVSALCPIGQFPTQFLPDGPVCVPLGGTTVCPTGEYLVSVGIGSKVCKPLPVVPVVAGICGTAQSTTRATAPSTTTELCTTGTATAVSGSGPWIWNCVGTNGGANVACSASKTPVPQNGACGSANGSTVASAPSSNLCNIGTYSTVTGTGPWNWTCAGLNGGTSAGCSASKTVVPTANVCCRGYCKTVVNAYVKYKYVATAADCNSDIPGWDVFDPDTNPLNCSVPPSTTVWADTTKCDAVPAVCPSGTTETGSGEQLPAPQDNCFCSVAGSTWNGSTCIASASCPTGSSMTGLGDALPAPQDSCKCDTSGASWDGSSCSTASAAVCSVSLIELTGYRSDTFKVNPKNTPGGMIKIIGTSTSPCCSPAESSLKCSISLTSHGVNYSNDFIYPKKGTDTITVAGETFVISGDASSLPKTTCSIQSTCLKGSGAIPGPGPNSSLICGENLDASKCTFQGQIAYTNTASECCSGNGGYYPGQAVCTADGNGGFKKLVESCGNMSGPAKQFKSHYNPLL